MKFNEYQEKTSETAVYPDDNPISYLAMGVTGEAGEIADKVKKHRRDGADLEPVIDEVGDLLWYIAQLVGELGYDLDEVAERNIEKINDRAERDKISGSGDNR